MFKKPLLVCVILLLVAQAALAQQDEDMKQVQLLAMSRMPSVDFFQTGLLDALEVYGFIDPADRTGVRGVNLLALTEHSPILFETKFADFQFDTLRELMADALDQGVDVIVTHSAPVTLAAIQATADMDDPPAIFFADVYNPYEAGIADAPCLKPAHVSGSISQNNYADLVELALMQDPDLETIGVIHDSKDASGVYGAAVIAEAAEAQGLIVEQAAVVSPADLALATDGLISKGIKALLLPVDYTTTAGLPLISSAANDQGIPVFYASIDGMALGATVGAGFFQVFDQGNEIGLMVAAYLNGDLDPAATGISTSTGITAVGINLHTAELMDFSFSEDLQARADVTLTMGDELPSVDIVSEAGMMEAGRIMFGQPTPLEAREESDRAFLAGLECTPERVAEQQAELDAMEG